VSHRTGAVGGHGRGGGGWVQEGDDTRWKKGRVLPKRPPGPGISASFFWFVA